MKETCAWRLCEAERRMTDAYHHRGSTEPHGSLPRVTLLLPRILKYKYTRGQEGSEIWSIKQIRLNFNTLATLKLTRHTSDLRAYNLYTVESKVMGHLSITNTLTVPCPRATQPGLPGLGFKPATFLSQCTIMLAAEWTQFPKAILHNLEKSLPGVVEVIKRKIREN